MTLNGNSTHPALFEAEEGNRVASCSHRRHPPMAPLCPAESLFLLKPNRAPARETVKVTLLSLIAQGMVRMEERQTRRFFGKKKTVYMWPRNIAGHLPPHATALLDLVRDAQNDTGSMADFAKRAQKAFGANLEKFNRDFIVPALLSRGLVEERRILIFRTYKRTLAGDAEESRIAGDIARARTIPELLHSKPAEAAAIVLAVGSTILLVSELRPHYRQISEVMRAHAASTDSADGGGDGPVTLWDSTGSHGHDPMQQGDPTHHLDAAALGGLDHGTFDLSAFDAGAFDALDTGMVSFDSGFDASVGDGGGGDGGGGDGGGGGGD
jgi:hypothetical protein